MRDDTDFLGGISLSSTVDNRVCPSNIQNLERDLTCQCRSSIRFGIGGDCSSVC